MFSVKCFVLTWNREGILPHVDRVLLFAFGKLVKNKVLRIIPRARQLNFQFRSDDVPVIHWESLKVDLLSDFCVNVLKLRTAKCRWQELVLESHIQRFDTNLPARVPHLG